MSRARNIKPSIMDNEDLARLQPHTRLLFIYLWMLADREGRLEDRPQRIKKQALGYDDCDVDVMLDSLHEYGFIVRYVVNDVALIQVTNFVKHQAPHIREQASSLPGPDQGTTKVVTKHNLGSAMSSPRSPDSLIPDSLIPDTNISCSKTRKSRASGDAQFDEFWKAYPKKVGKADALKAWKASKVNGEFPAVLAAVEANKKTQKWKDGYILDPVKWIKGRRWEDEIPTAQEQARKDTGPPWWSTNAGIEAKGAELGMRPRGGESWHDFKARINQRLETWEER